MITSSLYYCTSVMFPPYSHINQFTGTVYESILLSHQHHVRTLSMDEAVIPNTSPAQWPGRLQPYFLFYMYVCMFITAPVVI